MEAEGPADGRHKHLLEPIRDLATNWNIDLASELEDYLHELEAVTISFDDGESINFVEAALLIQGSACVYSKKVEYLYNLLYKCLEVVVAKKKTKEKNSANSEGIDTDALFNDLSYLLPLDEYIVDGKSTDLDDSKEFVYDKMRALTMISRPPMGALDRVEEGKQQFRVSDCTIHISGALLFRNKDGVLLDANLGRIKTLNPAAAELPFGSPQAIGLEQIAETRPPTPAMEVVVESVAETSQEESYPEFDGVGAEEDDDDDATDQKHGDSENEPKVDFKNADHDPLGTQIAEEVDADIPPDPWRLADPHEAPRTKPKPFRKVIPKGPRNIAASAATPNTFLQGLYVNPAEERVRQASAKNGLRAPYWPQFASLFVTRLQKLQHIRREQTIKDKAQLQRKLVMLPASMQADDPESADSEEEQDISPVFDIDIKDEVNEWDEPEPVIIAEPLETADEMATLGRTYEDVCRDHVDSYLDKATKFLSESQISKRVAEWQTKLEPTLAAEELRPPFDIHQYGRSLMEIMMTKNGLDSFTNPPAVKLDFHSAMEEKPRYDVCRYFLAALQLANNANVKISSSEAHIGEGKEAVPSMKLQLLSLERSEVNIEGGGPVVAPKRPRGKKKGVAEFDSKTNGDESDNKFEEIEEFKTSAPTQNSSKAFGSVKASEEKHSLAEKVKKRGRVLH